ncbi:phosphotransferase family protein [Frankia sp. R82]|uniref:phosphotransferase family protein n=1 Tax=Frankia sp. R82 TaxID=2950553 RepID=UPI002042DDB0|nr:phosphotransferase family protein [Frankia sp. R82]MCM3882540.1 phosphotransferase family protein [Frankia sp. R82]
MTDTGVPQALLSWLQEQMPSASGVRVEHTGPAALVGYSAELLMLTVAWDVDGTHHRQEVVGRLCPPSPGLLEPYDMARQVAVLRGLEKTEVRSPRVLWFEESGTVLGRPFYLMERLGGSAYEGNIPDRIAQDPVLVRRMSKSLIEQLATIHQVDIAATGLDALGDGRTYLRDDLEHWAAEMHRVQRDTLPGLERLLGELRARLPVPSERISLLHGDAKPGNFAYQSGEVSAVFDWEISAIGDPLADLGYLGTLWNSRVYVTSQPGALTLDEAISYYRSITGYPVDDLSWYKALACYKTCVIVLIGAMLFDAGHTDDLRFAVIANNLPIFLRRGLGLLGVDDDVDAGPVTPRPERVEAVRARLAAAAAAPAAAQ